MSRSSISACIVLSLVLLTWSQLQAADAHGDPDEQAASDQTKPRVEASADEPGWSLGVGVSLGNWGWGSQLSGDIWLAGQAPINAAQGAMGSASLGWYSLPALDVLVERRIGASLSLMMNLTAMHGNSSVGGGLSEVRSEHSSTRVGAGLGLRHLFNPGGVVEVSAYVAFEGMWQWGNMKMKYYEDEVITNQYTRDWDGYLLEAQAGLVLERRLVHGLNLRLATPLIGADYHHIKTQIPSLDGTSQQPASSNGFNAGLRISPQVQLRMLF